MIITNSSGDMTIVNSSDIIKNYDESEVIGSEEEETDQKELSRDCTDGEPIYCKFWSMIDTVSAFNQKIYGRFRTPGDPEWSTEDFSNWVSGHALLDFKEGSVKDYWSKAFNLCWLFEKNDQSLRLDDQAFAYYAYKRSLTCLMNDIDTLDKDIIYSENHEALKKRYSLELDYIKERIASSFQYKGMIDRSKSQLVRVGKVCVYPEEMVLASRLLGTIFNGTAIIYYPTKKGLITRISGKNQIPLSDSYIKAYISE